MRMCLNVHIVNRKIFKAIILLTQGGFSNVSGVTTGVGVGMSGRVGVGVGNTVGTQQTVLSMMATPPKKKNLQQVFL